MNPNWSTKTTVLFIFALGAICFLIYSIFSVAKDTPVSNTIVAGEVNYSKSVDKETFDLIPVPRDPFFGTLKQEVKIKTNTLKSTWPIISYNGMIENGKGTDKLYVLVINNSQQLFEKGMTKMGVTLVRGTSEKVIVAFEKETKEITQ